MFLTFLTYADGTDGSRFGPLRSVVVLCMLYPLALQICSAYFGNLDMLCTFALLTYSAYSVPATVFGPCALEWHQSALKENRQRAYDDFIAVGETLISTGVTSSEHLGIRGGSNGGLLVGAVVAQRPDLFNAVICAVPLLDMYRYDKLLAGASWVDEYGDPDNPEEWSFISKYSPYQNVFADKNYPEIYFYTSTKDDRVHPGHARKMAKKMLNQGHEVIYYENIEGGHSAAANLKQSAYMTTLQLEYLKDKLL